MRVPRGHGPRGEGPRARGLKGTVCYVTARVTSLSPREVEDSRTRARVQPGQGAEPLRSYCPRGSVRSNPTAFSWLRLSFGSRVACHVRRLESRATEGPWSRDRRRCRCAQGRDELEEGSERRPAPEYRCSPGGEGGARVGPDPSPAQGPRAPAAHGRSPPGTAPWTGLSRANATSGQGPSLQPSCWLPGEAPGAGRPPRAPRGNRRSRARCAAAQARGRP